MINSATSSWWQALCAARHLCTRIVQIPGLMALLILVGGMDRAASPDEPVKYVTGAAFTRLLNRPLLVNQDYTPLREVLNRLSAEREIAVCLDRRVDPEQLVLVDVNAPFFDAGIEVLASRASAHAVVLAETVFVTTPETASTLRTRLALADQELEQLSKPSLQRQLELSRKIPFSWDRLSSPRDVLVAFAERFGVTLENPEEIPYDLWDAGAISHAHFTAGALLIACQYGLDLQWIDPQTVRLIPENSDPRIDQDHLLHGRTKQQVTELMQQHFPRIPVQISGTRLRMTARIEEHEAADLLLGNRAPRKATASVMATNLSNRRFTLRMMNRPFLELVGVLEKQGIQFQYHEEQLQGAGIDLNQRISLELENATIEKLLLDACMPLGLAFQIEGTRVTLGIAPRPVPLE